jgi:topoisomerase-4 subunit B
MYIGGTDERALHHLAAEVLDNAMDEAVAGHANRIEVTLAEGNTADHHRQWARHSGGRASQVSGQERAGGDPLHAAFGRQVFGQGLCHQRRPAWRGHQRGERAFHADAVEVARNKELFAQEFSRGHHAGPIQKIGAAPNRRGTSVQFTPDPEIFGAEAKFKPARLFKLVRSKAYLFAGVEIRWKCAPASPARMCPPRPPSSSPAAWPTIWPNRRHARMRHRPALCRQPGFPASAASGRVEWAIAWPLWSDGAYSWYCNTIPTPDGGTHEQGCAPR